jgi:hypothetical protein
MIVVPIAIPDFLIEEKLGYMKGIMGANFWYFCNSKKAVLDGGRTALKAIESVKNVITPLIFVQQHPSLRPTIPGLDQPPTILTVPPCNMFWVQIPWFQRVLNMFQRLF